MLAEKFRRSISGIEELLPQSTVLTVCGGSGMDGQFLAEAGARVVVCDISLEAAKRSRTRAQRFGLDMESVVGDVERLPFPDGAFDIVYVHDGLHHLENPDTGLREMARTAKSAVSVTEPAEAALTKVAIRLGLALAEEEAGNKVERFRPARVREALSSCGFITVSVHRYAMFYRHEPGTFMTALSRSAVLPTVVRAWKLLNGLVGPVGNKLAVVATRGIPDGGITARRQESNSSSPTVAVEPSTTL
jgi:ubiquinone/menaquinone biosynthesis C-methylase UbiE